MQKRMLLVALFGLVILGCSESSGVVDTKESTGAEKKDDAIAVSCTEDNDGDIIYVSKEDSYYACDGEKWSETSVNVVESSSSKEKSSSSSNEKSSSSRKKNIFDESDDEDEEMDDDEVDVVRLSSSSKRRSSSSSVAAQSSSEEDVDSSSAVEESSSSDDETESSGDADDESSSSSPSETGSVVDQECAEGNKYYVESEDAYYICVGGEYLKYEGEEWEIASSSSESDVAPVASSSSHVSGAVASNIEADVKLYPVPKLKNILGNGTSGWNTRYWDGCKPHCSQISTDGKEGLPNISTQEEYAASHYTARVCNINDIEIPTFTYSKGLERYWVGYQNIPNACAEASPASGGGFTCTDMAPVAVNDTLAYAFVAGSAETTSCGKCFHLQYDGSSRDADEGYSLSETHKALKGKHIIVMVSNIGHDVKVGQFDLLVPGGGPGIFNALQLQITKPGIEWGATYGGFLTYCQNGEQVGYDGSLADYQKCVKNLCDAAFGDSKYPNLLRGCHWFADWYMTADNPTYQWEEVECPQYLVDKYSTTISTSIETKILYQSDWSKYKGGDFITTDACSKTPNATGEYCDPDQLAADKAKTY